MDIIKCPNANAPYESESRFEAKVDARNPSWLGHNERKEEEINNAGKSRVEEKKKEEGKKANNTLRHISPNNPLFSGSIDWSFRYKKIKK